MPPKNREYNVPRFPRLTLNKLTDRAKSIINKDEGILGFTEYKGVPVVEFGNETAWNRYNSPSQTSGASISSYTTARDGVNYETPFISINSANRPFRGGDPLTNELILEHEYSHLGREIKNQGKSLEGSYYNKPEEVQAFADQYRHLEGLMGSNLTPQAVTRLNTGDTGIFGQLKYNKELDPGAPFTQAARNARMLDMDFYNKPLSVRSMESARMTGLSDYMKNLMMWTKAGGSTQSIFNKPSQSRMISDNQSYLGMQDFHKNVSSQFGNQQSLMNMLKTGF